MMTMELPLLSPLLLLLQTLVQAVCMNNKTRIEGWSLKLIIQHAPGIDLDLEDKQVRRARSSATYLNVCESLSVTRPASTWTWREATYKDSSTQI